MKKIISILFIAVLLCELAPVACAVNVGTYKTETEYGLLDGFKINWKRKNKDIPFIEPREESDKRDKEREMQYYEEDEYYRTKYMYDGKAIF